MVNATRPHGWLVNIVSGNGLVLSGNKPLPEWLLTQIYITPWCHYMTMFYHFRYESHISTELRWSWSSLCLQISLHLSQPSAGMEKKLYNLFSNFLCLLRIWVFLAYQTWHYSKWLMRSCWNLMAMFLNKFLISNQNKCGLNVWLTNQIKV